MDRFNELPVFDELRVYTQAFKKNQSIKKLAKHSSLLCNN